MTVLMTENDDYQTNTLVYIYRIRILDQITPDNRQTVTSASDISVRISETRLTLIGNITVSRVALSLRLSFSPYPCIYVFTYLSVSLFVFQYVCIYVCEYV